MPVGPPADDDESQPCRALRRIGLRLGALERSEDALAQPNGVVDALEPGRDRLPFRMIEVRVPRPGRDDQVIVRDFHPAVGDDDPCRHVHPLHLGHQHGGVALARKQPPDRRRDVGGRERGGRDLIEQRLEEMVVGAVEHRELDVGAPEGTGRVQSSESAADDYHAWFAVFSHPERLSHVR